MENFWIVDTAGIIGRRKGIHTGSSCREVRGFYRRNLMRNEGLAEALNWQREFGEKK